MPEIDFRTIRPHRGDRRLGFEELVRQILLASPPDGCLRLEHKGPGADGGVEVLAHMPGGRVWGYQTKFFVDAFTGVQIGQIQSSFRSALTNYPTLDRYIVALPRNLSGNPAVTSQRDLWEAFVVAAQEEAAAADRGVTVELWDESPLIASLTGTNPVRAGMRHYWFDALALTNTWFEARFTSTVADLGERYHPAENVAVSTGRQLEVIARGAQYDGAVSAHLELYSTFRSALDVLRLTAPPLLMPTEWFDELQGELARLGEEAQLVFSSRVGPQDTAPLAEGLRAVIMGETAEAIRDRQFAVPGPALDPATEKAVRKALDGVFDAIHELQSTLLRLDGIILASQRLLVVGEAGAGKSHSLADLASRHLQENAPVVLLLGQHIGEGDPRTEIMNRLGLPALPFETFLGALHAAALAADRPGLILIDGLNESRNARQWRSNLAGLAADIARFSALALIVTCRETYEKVCIPDGLRLRRVVHRGFGGDGAKAAQDYLDRHGIDRPAAPFLEAEFTNPLFLSTTVRSLKRAGRSAFPAGFAGALELFEFWIDGVETSLLDKGYGRIRSGDGRIRRAVMDFADQLTLEQADTLPLDQATALFERAVSGVAATSAEDDLLWRLIDEGVVRREFHDDGERVGFTIQRFSDHFIVEALLRLFPTPTTLGPALRMDGDLAYLLHGPDAWMQAGLVEALAIQVPERFGVEMFDLTEAEGVIVEQAEDRFAASLRWRSPGAVSGATVARFDIWWDDDPVNHDEALELLFQLSSIPGHPLNADNLFARLSALPLSERDRLLAEFFLQRNEEASVDILLAWLSEARLDLAEPERVRLAATATAWFLSSSNRPLRDQASRALTRVFLRVPDLMAPLLQTFGELDDDYVRERLFAAASAAASHLYGPSAALRSAALESWRIVFARTPVPRHAFLRRYARSLIEAVAINVGLPAGIELERCRPPYASASLDYWPTVDDVLPLKDQASDIASSVLGHHAADQGRFIMPGDFGNYAMGSLGSDFSEGPRSSDPPPTKGEIRARFWQDLQGRGAAVAAAANRALAAKIALAEAQARATERFIMSFRLEDDAPSEEADPLEADLAEAEDALRATAAPHVLPERLPYPGHDDDHIFRLSNDTARRWVAWRAVDLGWREAIHGDVENRMGYWGGRHEHAVERIGKKYQWIAYNELIGALGDHHWYISWGETLSVLDDPTDIEDLDIDLSLFPGDIRDAPTGLPSMGLAERDFMTPETVEAGLAWARTLEDLPDPPTLLEAAGADGERWLLVEGRLNDRNYLEKLQTDGPMRTGQGLLQMILLPASEVEQVFDRWRRRRVNLGEILQDGYGRNRMFGELRAGRLPGTPLAHLRMGTTAFARLSRPFDAYKGEYDFGGGEAGPFEIPKEPVIEALGLRPAGPDSPWFVDARNRPAFLDMRVFGQDDHAVIVRAEVLEAAAQAHEMVPAWIYWGEKDGGQGAGHGFSRRGERVIRNTFSGLWWRDAGDWRGSFWEASSVRPNVQAIDDDYDYGDDDAD